MTADLDIALLGPLELRVDGRPVPLTRSKLRNLLALLALHAGATVGTETLIEELWGADPPGRTRTALQIHVSRLRHALVGAGSSIVTNAGGYVAEFPRDRVDVHQFEGLVHDSRAAVAGGQAAAAARLAGHALGLWRGTPFADVSFVSCGSISLRLEELRAEATEISFEAVLALGRHGEIVAPLELAVSEWPYRERLWRQLMLALYRDGRQADALAAYRRARELLDEGLGLEPGAELHRLERAILLHDPALDSRVQRPAKAHEAQTIIDVVSRATRFLPEGDPARLSLLPELAESLVDLGEWDAARVVLAETIEQGRGAVAAHAQLVKIRLELRVGGASLEELTQQSGDAIRVLEEDGDERRLAEAWTIHAAVVWRRCRADEAERALRRALDQAERSGDRRATESALHLLVGVGLLGPLPAREAARRYLELRGDPHTPPIVHADAGRALGAVRAMQGRFAEARRLVAEDERVLAEVGEPVAAAGATGIYGMIELYAGDPAAAARHLMTGYGALTGMGERSMRAVLAAQLARAAEADGRFEEALSFTHESEETAQPGHVPGQAPWRGTRARLLARAGDAEAAIGFAHDSVAIAFESDFLNHQGDALMDLGVTLALVGRRSEARVAFGRAAAVYRAKGNIACARTACAVSAGRATGATART